MMSARIQAERFLEDTLGGHQDASLRALVAFRNSIAVLREIDRPAGY